MSKKTKPKKRSKNAGPPKPSVRLSQCMIVKNEEQNIERALRWAKPVAFEQIVVDTGSTDRTVEIAKKMGAKVYHFEWINDFSAAKNFAIEQATGNWIAFLDADEYFSPEDAKHILYCLKRIQEDPEMRNRWVAINNPWAHVDENGKPFSIQDQERIFRSFVRYTGKIHERIDADPANVAHIDEVTIIHTGYARGAIDQTQKAERNIKMLRESIKENPDDSDAKVFLADSLQATDNPENLAEAEQLFYEAIETGRAINALKKKAYLRVISKYDRMPAKKIPIEELCLKALGEFPGDLDFMYFYAAALNQKGDYGAAMQVLKKCNDGLKDRDRLTNSELISANPELINAELTKALSGNI